MGSLYLTGLADWLRAAGVNVVEYAGWQSRARSSGGFDSGRPWGVMWHHTASSTSPQNDADYMCNGSSDKPIANLLVARDGSVWVLAAGATNTNGKGGPWSWSRGQVPTDSMNTYAVGMEIANNGVGEPYSQVQVDAAFATSIAIIQNLGLAGDDVCQHWNYAPTRKIDPATAAAVQGPWVPQSCTSSGTWLIDDLINEHWARINGNVPPPDPTPPDPTPPDPVPPDPTPPPEDDWMANLPTISNGDSGPYVKRMQHLLASNGYMNEANTANYDGVWGSGTDGAKARFDSDHGLGGSDTSCGPKSWQSLMDGTVW